MTQTSQADKMVQNQNENIVNGVSITNLFAACAVRNGSR
jgi:hypothetical protein